MKKHYLFLATLLVVAAVSAAVVSCKKDDPKTMLGSTNQSTKVFAPPQIEDMYAYLKDFKKKLKESKGDETMGLDEAAWHLACLANVDFCKINVDFDDVQFDTIEMKINVNDDAVFLSDLNSAYENMRGEIERFKKSFNHNNQNLYFINVIIYGDSNAKIALMTSFSASSKDLDDHLWYFPDTFGYIDSVCNYYFNDNAQYVWDGYAKTELQRILNLFEHHESIHEAMCFTPTRNYTFQYPDWPDRYGNSFLGNSRVFAFDVSIGSNIYLSTDEMCYCLDSYLGLGYDYIVNNYLYSNEHPVNWTIDTEVFSFPNHRWPTHFHKLTVQYGQLNVGPIDPPSD
jgi:hypothetical protein